MEDVLIVVDMQNDFVSGSLGTRQAQEIAERVAQKIRSARAEGRRIVFTLDTHDAAYLSTQEGKNLPVSHCIKGEEGWRLCPPVRHAAQFNEDWFFEKPAFGSVLLAQTLAKEAPGRIELVGVCTDICVVSNALLLKAFLPEAEISVDAACCAGVTPESHLAALKTLKSCQILVKNEENKAIRE